MTGEFPSIMHIIKVYHLQMSSVLWFGEFFGSWGRDKKYLHPSTHTCVCNKSWSVSHHNSIYSQQFRGYSHFMLSMQSGFDFITEKSVTIKWTLSIVEKTCKSTLCRKSKGPSRMISSTTNITKKPNLQWQGIQGPKPIVWTIHSQTCVKSCDMTKYTVSWKSWKIQSARFLQAKNNRFRAEPTVHAECAAESKRARL